MAQSAALQLKELIDRSKKILITTKKQYSGDGLASCLAFYLTLKKLNKNAEVVIDDFNLPENYKFLPGAKEIQPTVKKAKKFIINLDISQTGIESLNYDIQGQNLRIHLSPSRGVFTPEDLRFETSEFAYDLILIIDTPELESLGKLYDWHRDLFSRLPVVNLDHNLSNEQYGHLNIVEITASSGAEIIYRLLDKWPVKIIDSAIATCLLTGLIDKTRSFKTSNVSPEVLKIAGDLINLGANRKEIVTQLYQTKTIPMLKIWGKVLSRLEYDPRLKAVWSKLDLHDFTESHASEKDLLGVTSELIALNPLAEIIILFYQASVNQTKVIMHCPGLINALSLSRQFAPQGDKRSVAFVLDETLDQAETTVLGALPKAIIS